MIYKFRSKAAGDVIMLGPNGDQLLRLLGREPAARGIFEAAAMPELIAALRAAVAAEEAEEAEEAGRRAQDARADDAPAAPRGVTLRQRVWPMVQMLERSQAAGEPVVWGV